MFILYVGCKSTKKAKVPNFKVSIWNSNYYFYANCNIFGRF